MNSTNNYNFQHTPTTFSKSLLKYATEEYHQIELMESVEGFEGLGRCLIAKRDFDKGDLLFSEAPMLSIASYEKEASCQLCHSSCKLNHYKQCKDCKAFFCSMCKAFEKMRENPSPFKTFCRNEEKNSKREF